MADQQRWWGGSASRRIDPEPLRRRVQAQESGKRSGHDQRNGRDRPGTIVGETDRLYRGWTALRSGALIGIQRKFVGDKIGVGTVGVKEIRSPRGEAGGKLAADKRNAENTRRVLNPVLAPPAKITRPAVWSNVTVETRESPGPPRS
jgi:hypothetical protein